MSMISIRCLALGMALTLAVPFGAVWAQQGPPGGAPAPAQQPERPRTAPKAEQQGNPANQGRPPEMANSPRAPHAPRLTVTPPDRVPLDRLRVPDGFRVELWAHGMPGERMMAMGDNGTVFVGTRTIGRVYAVTEQGGQRQTRVIAQGL